MVTLTRALGLAVEVRAPGHYDLAVGIEREIGRINSDRTANERRTKQGLNVGE